MIHPASTGKDNNSKIAVIKTDHTYKLIRFIVSAFKRIISIVVIKFIAPAIEDTPAKCKLKILKSTEAPEWASSALNGGYIVQPVPAPDSTTEDNNNKNKDTGNNQKLRLFNLGNDISGTPSIIGINQLPKAPIKMGITMKKIIIRACAVTITLYIWLLPYKKKPPGQFNSKRINIDK